MKNVLLCLTVACLFPLQSLAQNRVVVIPLGSCGSGDSSTYTVAGGVWGLDSNGLVLQNNGADDLPVAGYWFEFPAALDDGASYDVTVQTHPDTQGCDVVDGSGVVTGDDVSKIRITCYNLWDDPVKLENDSMTVRSLQIGMDDVGNAVAVWMEQDSFIPPILPTQTIHANSYSVDSGWGTSVRINHDLDGLSFADYPQVVVSSTGTVLAVWSQGDDTSRGIYASRMNTNGSWALPTKIDTAAVWANDPQIAMDSSGYAVAVWSQSDGTGDWDIVANHYTTSGWGTAGVIDGAAAGNAGRPQIAMDSSGNAVAVWYQIDGTGDWDIVANHYTTSGWGTAGVIDGAAGKADSPQVAMDSSGNAVVVWRQDDGTGDYNIVANRYTTSGWDTAAMIGEAPEDYSASRPQVAVDDSGNAVAVWQLGNDYVVSNRYTANTNNWGTAEVIDDAPEDNFANMPQIAVDGSGNAVAVWQQAGANEYGNPGPYSIYANRYTAGSGWSTPRTVESTDAAAMTPQIAVDGSGNNMVVWMQIDSTVYSAFASYRLEW